MHALVAQLDDFGKPAWIALTVVSFILFWPLGLLVLGFLIGSGRMACWGHGGTDRWQRRMERMQSSSGCTPRALGLAAIAAPAATAPLTNIAPRPCAGSKKSSANSRRFSTACVTPRTRPSSTNSWPSTAVPTALEQAQSL